MTISPLSCETLHHRKRFKEGSSASPAPISAPAFSAGSEIQYSASTLMFRSFLVATEQPPHCPQLLCNLALSQTIAMRKSIPCSSAAHSTAHISSGISMTLLMPFREGCPGRWNGASLHRVARDRLAKAPFMQTAMQGKLALLWHNAHGMRSPARA